MTWFSSGRVTPVIKESTKVLLQSSYLPILFTTATFAMGVNISACIVLFTAIHKLNSKYYTLLETGECFQRQADPVDVGGMKLYRHHVPILIWFPSCIRCEGGLSGTTRLLRSPLLLTYNIILNVLRIHDLPRFKWHFNLRWKMWWHDVSANPAKCNSKFGNPALEKGSKKRTTM